MLRNNMVYYSLVLLRGCLWSYQGTCVLQPPLYHAGRTHTPDLINPKTRRLVSLLLWRFLSSQVGLGCLGPVVDIWMRSCGGDSCSLPVVTKENGRQKQTISLQGMLPAACVSWLHSEIHRPRIASLCRPSPRYTGIWETFLVQTVASALEKHLPVCKQAAGRNQINFLS